MKKTNFPIFTATLITLMLLTSCTGLKTSKATKLAESPKIPAKETLPDIKKCICIQLWMPVCGEDGKTYSNACFAKCAGVKFTQGPCTKKMRD